MISAPCAILLWITFAPDYFFTFAPDYFCSGLLLLRITFAPDYFCSRLLLLRITFAPCVFVESDACSIVHHSDRSTARLYSTPTVLTVLSKTYAKT